MLTITLLTGTAFASAIVALCLSHTRYAYHVYTASGCYIAFAFGFSALAII